MVYSEVFNGIVVSYPFGTTEVIAFNEASHKCVGMYHDVLVEIHSGMIEVYDYSGDSKGRLLISSSNFTFKFQKSF